MKKIRPKLNFFIQNSFKSCKISTFNFRFLSSMNLHKLRTPASSDQYNFGLIRQGNINNISYESYILSQ